MKKFVLVTLAVCLFSTNAFSKGGGSVVTPAARGFNVKFAKDGQPLVVTAGATPAALAATSGFSIPVVPGVTVEGLAAGIITGAASAGALGAAMGALGVVAIAAIPAIKDWMLTAGARINTDNVLETAQAPANQYAGLYCSSGAGAPLWFTYFPISYGSSGFAPGPNVVGYACGVQGNYTKGFDWAGTIARDPNWVPVGQYAPASVAQAVGLVALAAPSQQAVQALVDLNFPPAVDPGSLSVPPSVFIGNTVKINSDGSTETTEESATLTVISPDYVAVDLKKLFTKTTAGKTESRTESVSTTNPDGSVSVQTVTRTISTPAGTATSTQTETKPDVAACGLPGTPPCVIDESGMPGQIDIDAKMDKTRGEKIEKDIMDIALDPINKLPKLPTLNWAFVLPTGCAMLPLPAFDPFVKPIDICQFQPMFHDLMSIVWTLGGLFGAISLFMKSALAD